jgi:hypothetical protein
MAANFRNWSKEGVIGQEGKQKECRREEKKLKKQQVAGVEAGWDKRNVPTWRKSAPPRAKKWALVAAFRGLAQAAYS